MSAPAAPSFTQVTVQRGRQFGPMYVASFTQESWDAGGSTISFSGAPTSPRNALVGQRNAAYLGAAAEFGTPLTQVPKHVHLILCTRAPGREAPRLRFSKAQQPTRLETAVTWVYFLEASREDRRIHCVGGVSEATFKTRTLNVGGDTLSIPRAICSPLSFFVKADYDKETSLPGVPDSLSASLATAFSISSSGTISPPPSAAAAAAAAASASASAAAAAGHPLLDYAGHQASDHVLALRDIVAPKIPLPQLLRHRYDTMENVARFKKLMGVDISYVAAYGSVCTPLQVSGASTIGLIDELGGDGSLQHAGHLVSHWLVRRFILDKFPVDHSTWKWFAQRETELVTQHVRFAADLDHLLVPVVDHFNLTRVQAHEVPDGAHAAASELPAPPTSWYSMDAIDALTLSLQALCTHGASQVYICPTTHQAYLSSEQVADDLIPLFIDACIRGNVPAPDVPVGGAGGDVVLIGDGEETQTPSPEMEMDGFIAAEAARILEDRAANAAGATSGLYLPRNDVDPKTLFHLDNGSAYRFMTPLCVQRRRNKMVRDNHLEYGERLAWAAHLLDLGYKREVILDNMFLHFAKKGISRQQFDASHANCVVYNEKNKWEDGVREIPYDISCRRRIEGTDLPGDSRTSPEDACVACPYARLSTDTLRRELQASIPPAAKKCSPGDIEDIVATAKTQQDPGAACAKHFAALYGGTPYPTWRPSAPRGFTQPALESIREAHRRMSAGGV